MKKTTSKLKKRTDSRVSRRAAQAVIPRERVQHVGTTCVVGGDSPDQAGEDVPTIIIEKDRSDEIARIVVRCPCGRCAELICDYE